MAIVPDFDPTTPSIARVYDYLLDGKDNFAVDREVAQRMMAVAPLTAEVTRENRQFLTRAVAWAANRGITQFIDLGCGLPTAPNTHVTAQAASPAAAAAYVDNDPVVLSHLTALLAHHSDRVAVIAGDLHDRDAVLGATGLRAVIDLSKPVCVVMGMILHFDTAHAAAGLVKRYMSAAVPGSCLIATIASGKGSLAGRFYQTYNASGFATMYNHSSADFASFFGDLEIIPPGLGDARQIHPGWGELATAAKRPDRILAGIARVP